MKSRSTTARKKTSSKKKDSKTTRNIVLALASIFALVAVYLGASQIDNVFSNRESDSSLESVAVTIAEGSFSPEALSVQKGQAVSWTNTSDNTKSISISKLSEEADQPTGKTEVIVNPNEVLSYVFDTEGTYTAVTLSGEVHFTNTITVN